MKPNRSILSGCIAVALTVPAVADTIYSNLLDTPVPTGFTGVTLDINGGTINPFFGGVGVANNNLFQPVRIGTGNLDSLSNLSVGSVIDVNDLFSTGSGGSQTHLGTTFTAGQEGNIGFQLNGTDYGWMRVVFTGNTSGAFIKDWAYDNSGQAIVVGRVNQSAVSAGTQIVTLSPGIGESFSLGSVISDTGGNINSMIKAGAGTTILTQSNTYTGATTINGGTLALGSTGSIDNTSSVSLGASGTFDVSAKTGGYTVNELTGSGNVAGALTIATRLEIGNSPGTTSFSDHLTLGASSTYRYELTSGGAAADLGIVSGDLTLTDGSVLELFQLGNYTPNDTFTLFTYSGTFSGNFAGLADDSTFTGAGGLWRINYDNTSAGLNGGTVVDARYVTVTAVPEPASLLLGGLGLLVLLRRRR